MFWIRKLFGYKSDNLSRKTLKHLAELESEIQYRFHKKSNLIDALKHRSALQVTGEERSCSNERLEFLGDAVLDFIIAEYFYHLFPQMVEGELTKLRSIIVSGSALVRAAQKIKLGEYIILSPNEERTGGRERASILEDAYEALVGAVYLDGGHKAAQRFVEINLMGNWREVVNQKEFVNYKSLILEHTQSQQWSNPVYALREESGPDHSKHFVVEIIINGIVQGRGEGASKKAAEQKAASMAAERLGLIPAITGSDQTKIHSS
jgi:ribonuclease III